MVMRAISPKHGHTEEAGRIIPLEPLLDVVKSLRNSPAEIAQTSSKTDSVFAPLGDALKQAGTSALPVLLRSLTSAHELESQRAAQLLRELFLTLGLCAPAADASFVGGAIRNKIIARLNALLVDSKLGDACKARVLGLLADLRAPVPDAVSLQDPDALLDQSVRELLDELDSPEALQQALDLIFEQVLPDEFSVFLEEVVAHGGTAATPLLAALITDARTPRPIAQELIKVVRPVVLPLETTTEKKRTSPASMQRALRLLSRGQLDSAHQELMALRHKRENDLAVHSALGLCLLQLNQPQAALKELERAAELAKTVATHAWNAAVAAHLAEDVGRCYQFLRQYLECDDTRPGAAARRQAATLLCDEFERVVTYAFPHLSIAQVLESEALFAKAYTALRDARYTAAVQGFAAVLQRLPAHPASWRNLGLAYMAERRPREAARCFSRVLRLDSQRHMARAEYE